MNDPGRNEEETPGGQIPGGSESDPPRGNPPRGHLHESCVLRHRFYSRADSGLRVCEQHLIAWQDMLADVQLLYPSLGALAVPGPSTEEHTRGKKNTRSKPPFRLEVMVAADNNSTSQADGVTSIGALTRWAVRLGEERHLQRLPQGDVMAKLTRMRLHLRWIGAAEWCAEFDDDLRSVVSSLRRIAGDVSRPRVGTCAVLNEDGEECKGALLADRFGVLGVSCVKCGDRWDEGELRRLGQILASQ